MLKRVLTLVVAAGLILTAGCSSGGGRCSGGLCMPVKPHCEKPCYCKSFQRSSRQIMDVIDVHLLNYDRHDPFRCDPCIGD
ncbi:MAG: hypothetical protein JNM10_10870 [Planctomycetia bacterium]|nr:hypothetical protein [Planctomycetia bacterium]